MSGFSTQSDPPALNAEAQLFQMQAQIKTLQESVGKLLALNNSHSQVTLNAMPARAFLGQQIHIIAHVQDFFAEKPRMDIPVTFVTNWGNLRIADGQIYETASSVTGCSDLDGLVRIAWLPPTSQDLRNDEQQAIQSAVLSLNVDASSPTELKEPLCDLARQYRQEANGAFRRAVDIYFRDFRTRLVDTVNFQDFMTEWDYFNASVVAFVGSNDNEALVGGVGCLRIHLKNWLGPLLQSYIKLPEFNQAFQQSFEKARQSNQSTSALIDAVYLSTQKGIERHVGEMGQYAAQRIAESNLQTFIESLRDLPLEIRLGSYPALRIAARLVGTGGANSLATLAQSHLIQKQPISIDEISGLSTRLAQLDQALGRPPVPPAPTPISEKDVIAKLEDLAAESSIQLDWKTSIVDLLKLLGIDSNYNARKELAIKLGCPANLMADSANMNIWLHKIVLKKIAEYGGNIPEELLAMDVHLRMLVDRISFNSFAQEVNTRLGSLIDKTNFDVFTKELNLRLDSRVDMAFFEAFTKELNIRLGTFIDQIVFDTFIKEFNTRLDSLVDTTRFDVFVKENAACLEGAKSDLIARQESRLIEISTQASSEIATKLGIADFQMFSQTMTEQINNKLSTAYFDKFLSTQMEPLSVTILKMRNDIDQLMIHR